MTIKSRKSLKLYFREGELPTESHFADLIDSMLNMSDEGFRKTIKNGFEVYAAVEHDTLLSFYRDQSNPDIPLWNLSFGGSEDPLLLRAAPPHNPLTDRADDAGTAPQPSAGGANGDAAATNTVLSLQRSGDVGLGVPTPRDRLDVAGTIRSSGRRGTFQEQPATLLLADGTWQDLVVDLEGCQAFEIVAGVGHSGKGRFSLLHAIAVNTYNPTLGLFDFLNRKRGIRSTHGYYSRRCDRLELRWLGSSGNGARYKLQIRTRCDFHERPAPTLFGAKADAAAQAEKRDKLYIQAQVTQLWFDPHMHLSQIRGGGA